MFMGGSPRRVSLHSVRSLSVTDPTFNKGRWAKKLYFYYLITERNHEDYSHNSSANLGHFRECRFLG